ncbi:hypothetical protein A0256_13990 [Mucilaginibacter sp. PAMC 26640]|nr:hypothetical protein A0256_13990 [Mucilaginibacter sp. PAMC 26640]
MPKRNLIIKDNSDILGILSIIYKEDGYSVFLSDYGSEMSAVNEIKQHPILLDILLKNPAQNGISICSTLKFKPNIKKLPVFFLSGEANLPFSSKKFCADAYNHKTFDKAYLSTKVIDLNIK